MTEHEDLIARLRNRSGVQTADVNERVRLMDEAADALKKVTAERDVLSRLREQMSLRLRVVEGKREQAEAERDATRRRNAEITRSSNEKNDVIAELEAERDALKVDLETKSIVHECCEKAQERDQLAAVVEQMRDVLTSYPNYGVRFAVENVLNTAPSVALDRVKAEAWEEGVDATCAAYAIVRTRGYVTNPYRKGESDE